MEGLFHYLLGLLGSHISSNYTSSCGEAKYYWCKGAITPKMISKIPRLCKRGINCCGIGDVLQKLRKGSAEFGSEQ